MLVVAACGAALIACGILCQLIQFYVSIRDRDQNRDLTGDPWGGRTLEWATSSPPPFYNFAVVPNVHERDAFWEMKEKAKRTSNLRIMKKFICRKQRRGHHHCCIRNGVWLRDDLAYLVDGDCWFRRHRSDWIIKSFDEDVDYYVPVAEVENWKISISMRLTKQG